MQIPVARTFVAGETETATYMNSLGAAVNFLLNPPRCKVWLNAVFNLANATPTVVPFDQEQYDTDNIHYPSPNPSRFTPNTAGLYEVKGQLDFTSNATGFRQLAILLNGSAVAFDNEAPVSGGATVTQVSDELYLNGTTDYVELQASQSSGAAITVPTGLAFTWFSCRWVGNS